MSECPRFVTLCVHFRNCIFNILQWSSTTREVIYLFIVHIISSLMCCIKSLKAFKCINKRFCLKRTVLRYLLESIKLSIRPTFCMHFFCLCCMSTYLMLPDLIILITLVKGTKFEAPCYEILNAGSHTVSRVCFVPLYWFHY
jgi:hypothetical protein